MENRIFPFFSRRSVPAFSGRWKKAEDSLAISVLCGILYGKNAAMQKKLGGREYHGTRCLLLG